MEIRLSDIVDREQIMEIYAQARKFMIEQNNPHQWADSGYPSIDLIDEDIEKERSYVCVEKDKVLAVFVYSEGVDPDYREITHGQWPDDETDYGVVHRLAVLKGTNGIGAYCLDWAYNLSGNLRIDTHRDNVPMQNLLKKLGFTQCGIIYISDGSERLAYYKKKMIRF